MIRLRTINEVHAALAAINDFEYVRRLVERFSAKERGDAA